MKRKTGKTKKYGNRGASRPAGRRAKNAPVRSLVRDHRKKKGAPVRRGAENLMRVSGVFDYSGSGYGFCRTCAGGEDVFIPAGETMGAMTGDTVSVEVRGTSSGRVEGAVTAIEEHATASIIGTVVPVGADYYLDPKNAKLRVSGKIEGGVPFGPGDLIEAVPGSGPYFVRRSRRASFEDPLTGRPEPPLLCRAVKNFGDSTKRRPNCEAVLSSSGIPTVFPESVLEEAREVSKTEISADGRIDLREELIFTLDGAGAKDLDDAVSLKKTKDGFELGVHIADVSYYVKEGGALDLEAKDRGTSVYFTDRVVPMLPVELSNGCCSLNGGEDRYALSIRITLDKKGVTKSAKLCRSVIRSRLRGVYSEANDVFENGESSPYYEKYAEVADTLSDMWELACLLKAKREASGMVELAEDEAAIVLGENGEPVDVVKVDRGKTERIIEQLMLEANIAAAMIGRNAGIPFVYREHENPSPEKLHDLEATLTEIRVDPHGVGSSPPESSWRAIKAILADARGESPELYDTVSGIILRSMMKAKYTAAPSRHFGIGADIYCHFTSPIRRYPDLFVHRELSGAAVKAGGELVMNEADRAPAPPAPPKKAVNAAVISSDREVRAVAAEREIESLYIADWMSGMIGQPFDAVVCSVTKFGMFVRLGSTAEGLVPMAEFGDGATVSKSGAVLTAPGAEFRVGDRVRVRLTAADVSTGKLTFGLVK